MVSMLAKAFSEAMNNPALRFADSSVDLIVIRSAMMAYLDRNDYEYTDEEVENYIKEQFAKINESLKDFSYGSKIMF